MIEDDKAHRLIIDRERADYEHKKKAFVEMLKVETKHNLEMLT